MLLGIIKMLTGNDNQHVFSSLYMSVVRRILEYAVLLLSPSVIKDIESIENVQRRVEAETRRHELRKLCRLLN